MSVSDISVIICSKNEEKSIGKVIAGCLEHAGEVIIIDGLSHDSTVEIARAMGARVFLDGGNGKGEAVRIGISKATRDVLVFIDADGSHDPQDIPRMVQPIFDGVADHVSGSRMRGGSDELHGDIGKFIRMVGSDIITLGINYRFGVRLTESQNGFRAIRRAVALKLDLKENITTIEQEMIIKTLRKGYRITEIPAHEYERFSGDSNIDVKRVWFRYVYTWLKYMFF